MARSTYVYLITDKANESPLAAFTVKRTANEWAQESRFPLDQLRLLRTRDGGYDYRRPPEGRWERTNAEFEEIPFDKP